MNRKQTLMQQLISGLLFIAVVVMLGWLSVRYKTELDWTAGHRNTLTDASVKQLESMKDPIKILVFMYPRSEQRQSIEADLEKYRRVKPDISIEFIDPSVSPQKVKEYNISQAGELVAEYQGRHETITATTEPIITSALQRLTYSGERWVVFLEGHGERGIADNQRDGYSKFAQSLRDKGLKVQTHNLARNPKVPDNTAVLVIASPGKALLEGESKIVADYVSNGGNLLWLADPETPPGMDVVAKLIGLSWLNGTAILLDSAALGLPPFVYVTTQYPANPVTKGFEENALFPLVRGLSFKSDGQSGGFQPLPLLTTTENAWLETGKIEGSLELNANQGDVKGPLSLGATFTRTAKVKVGGPTATASGPSKSEDRPQRVAVIGDSDFLTNSYVGQLGNGLLGLNLVQWLASRDAQLNIDVPKAPDHALELPGWGFILIYASFAFLIPVLLLGFGLTRWIIRRRR